LSKTQGEHVRRGEVIGFSGNTGALTSGPHLHFELWFEGDPVDPLDFIEF
jgi:murein DD-endopeptidase MepM/ murein hydrolase activator NlpD